MTANNTIMCCEQWFKVAFMTQGSATRTFIIPHSAGGRCFVWGGDRREGLLGRGLHIELAGGDRNDVVTGRGAPDSEIKDGLMDGAHPLLFLLPRLKGQVDQLHGVLIPQEEGIGTTHGETGSCLHHHGLGKADSRITTKPNLAKKV